MKQIRFLAGFLAGLGFCLLSPTSHAQYAVAGNLYVDLRASDPTAASGTWTNLGTLGNFTRFGSPAYITNVLNTGIPGLLFGGADYHVGPAAPSDITGGNDWSIEIWTLNPALAAEETLLSWGRRGASRRNNGANFGSDLRWGAATFYDDDLGWNTADLVPSAGQWHHMVLTYDGGTAVKQYVDGVLVVQKTLASPLVTESAYGINVGCQRNADGGTFSFQYTGYINSLRVHSGLLTAEQVSGNYSAGPAIASGPVKILAQPQDVTVPEGGTATFSVMASGSPPVTHQWFRNGAPIPNATERTYSIQTTVLDEGAVFSVRVSNLYTNVEFTEMSTVAVLHVVADTNPPVLLQAQSTSTNGVVVFFSESVQPNTATNLANYTLLNGGNVVTISSATLSASGTIVTLATDPLAVGTTYVLRVSGLVDYAYNPNPIFPGSETSFQATSYMVTDIGNLSAPGLLQMSGDTLRLTADGRDIGGTGDQFSFAWQSWTGDFDFQTRVQGLTLSEVWTKAGLMARDSFATNSRFAAVLSTPSIMGELFAYRSAIGVAAVSSYGLEANYPNTWLRLQRVGNQFTGFGSYDGKTWSVLGSVSLSLTDTLYVGFALSSHQTGRVSTVTLSDLVPTVSTNIGTMVKPGEPLGPSTRRTGLVVSEIMYRPRPREDGRVLEFVEIYNSNPFFHDISGYRLSGGIDYTFPAGTKLEGGAFIVLASNPGDVQAEYGIGNVYGPYSRNLGTSDTIIVHDEQGTVLLEIEYENRHPWPTGADGTGHSIVLARPSYGENDPRAWDISDVVGGSPGVPEAFRPSPLRNVMINEVLANSGSTEDYVELYNHSSESNDISGCILTDNPSTNKFRVPTNTVIPPAGFVVFTQTQLGFGLKGGGDTVYFVNPDATRVLDAVRFEGQGTGIALGRRPDGGRDFYSVAAQTPGTNNGAARIHDIVINELMYNPISKNNDDQYIELYNQGTNAYSLADWRFVDGVQFRFPSNTIIPPRGYIVVAKNSTNLFSKYSNLNSGNTLGNFSGSLSHGGERVALAMPEITLATNQGVISTNTSYVVVDEVTYADGGRWGRWADGGGSSLELIDARGDHRQAANWADSDESGKSSWTTIQATGVLDNGANYASNPINFAQLGQIDPGECLIDDIEVLPAAGSPNYVINPGVDSDLGGWSFQGCFSRSTLDVGAGYGGSGALHLRTDNRLFSMANSAQTMLNNTTLGASQSATLRFKARWLKGCPEIVMRLAGNWLEASGSMQVPGNLGTPGAANSRAVANAGPAIYAVTHEPALPGANEPFLVTAQVSDPDGVANLLLQYRIEPALSYESVPMTDVGLNGDAVAGDGVFTAPVPGRPAGSMAAFIVTAEDALGQTARFPGLLNNGAPERECLVRWGEPKPALAFGTYHFWFSQTNVNRWMSLPTLSNEDIDGTIVYNNRIIYNMVARYAGSPYHQAFSGPAGNNACHYNMEVPTDDKLLGHSSFNKIHWIGNDIQDDSGTANNNDPTLQREQVAYTLLRGLGQPWVYRRYVRVYVNGTQRGQLMEDALRPSVSVPDAYFPGEEDGFVFKFQPWFEGGPAMNGDKSWPWENKSWCYYTPYTTTGGAHKQARYRWIFEPRQSPDRLNNYSNIYNMINVGTNYASSNYVAQMMKMADMENWMRLVAANHAAGNWDCYGIQNGQNIYGYVSSTTPWTLFMFDFSIVLGNRISWGPGANLENITPDLWQYIYSPSTGNPTFRRMYWRALKELANGAMTPSIANPLMDAKYNAFRESGITATDPRAIKDWVSQARDSIASQVAARDTAQFTVATNWVQATTNSIVLSGVAPLEVTSITINGASWPLTWSSTVGWSLRAAVPAGTNTVTVLGYDRFGRIVPGSSNQLVIANPVVPQSALGNLVISEIMYKHPQVADAEFVEIYNQSTEVAFDLSGWRFNGLSYTFPAGAFIMPRGYLVLVKDRIAYAAAYGTTAPVFDDFDGNLQGDGETLTLLQPGSAPGEEIVIDQVRYEGIAPWPPCASPAGASLQVIDVTQDNSRVSNWSDGSGWRYFSYTGRVNANRLAFMFPDNNGAGGDVYIDDIVLVSGSIAGEGTNLIRNASFETGLANWVKAGPATNTYVVSGLSHEGSNCLRLIMTPPAPPSQTYFYQSAVPIITNATYTLSFWYQPGTNGVNLQASLGGAFVPKASLRSVAPTPGTTNAVVSSLPSYPPLWLNELQAINTNTRTNRFGQYAPWVELYNAGTTEIALGEYFLANNYQNLTQWSFPPDSIINPGEFMVIWLDGADSNSIPSELHANFTIPQSTGAVALVRMVNSRPQIVDYLNYSRLGASLSYGDYPDGQAVSRQVFFNVTPGGANDPQHPLLLINEWVAQNQALSTTGIAGFADPADNDYDDWFEIYNPNPLDFDLSGYYLTDTSANRTQYRVPQGYIVPAYGFLVVWADNETGQNDRTNQSLHANFQLSRSGEQIGIYDPKTNLVDLIAFGVQTANVSQGRPGDGAPAPFVFLSEATPGAPNIYGSLNTAPTTASIPTRWVTLGQTLNVTIPASDSDVPAQTLTFNLLAGPAGSVVNSATGVFQWTPVIQQAPGSYTARVVMTDNGFPPMSATNTFSIQVLLPPAVTIGNANGQLSISWPTIPGRHYRVEYTDELNTNPWQPLSGYESVAATSTTLALEFGGGVAAHRFYRIVQLD